MNDSRRRHMAEKKPVPNPGGVADTAAPKPAKDYSTMSPDELLMDTIRSWGPMAPDRPRGFSPALHRETIRDASVIFARLPHQRVLLYSVVDGREVDLIEFMSMPAVPCISVRCEDEEDVQLLRELIAEVKYPDPGPRNRRSPGRPRTG
jgi:hypothetical protein